MKSEDAGREIQFVVVPGINQNLIPDNFRAANTEVDSTLARLAYDRMVGIGADQYATVAEDGSVTQKFEEHPACWLIGGLREELADALNYIGMFVIRSEQVAKDTTTPKWALEANRNQAAELAAYVFELNRKLRGFESRSGDGPCSTEESE